MAMASRFGPAAHPASPAPTTASSLNYSQYGSTSFASPPHAHQPRAPVPSLPTSYAGSSSSRVPSGAGAGATGLGQGMRSAPNGAVPRAHSERGAERKAESREVARVHWKALKSFLAAWVEKESPTARASAREKLTRLTKLQFQELSTDVYDELMRRIGAESGSLNGALPFLPVRDDFHPKRNQARQKLATLPKNRFKDLASDVFFELRRRYPEFEEAETLDPAASAGFGAAVYGEPPPAPGPAPARPGMQHASTAPVGTSLRDNQFGSSNSLTHANQYPSSSTLRDQSVRGDRDERGPSQPPSRSHSQSQLQHARLLSSGSLAPSQSHHRGQPSLSSHRSRPSRDRDAEFLADDDADHEPRFSGASAQPNLTAATSEVVVPTKSRLREEDIEVPYARDSVVEPPSRSSRPGSRASMQMQRDEFPYGRAESRASNRDRERDQDRDRGGERAHAAHEQSALSPAMTDDREYYDRISLRSDVTGRSRTQREPANGWDDEREQKIRAEYEFRIAGLERRAHVAETERDEARRAAEDEKAKRLDWEEEVRGLKERAAGHANSLRSIQHELDVARDAAEAARRHAETSGVAAHDEIAQWRDRCDALEDELRHLEDEQDRLRADVDAGAGAGAGVANGDGDGRGARTDMSADELAELKTEMRSLVDELSALSVRNDELMAARERDAAGMHEMEQRVEEFRRKWEAARIELRNLKATSTMFVSKPVTDDHLPASPDGNIADINVSAFQHAIDGLLSAARSSHPSGVLPAMKAIVESVTNIGEDVKSFEARPNLDVDVNRLESLKHESTARLNNLMQAARAHAMASGLSPVALLDAAAGHLSANVVEIIKLLKIRRSGRTREILNQRSSMSFKDMVRRSSAGEIRAQTASPSPAPSPAPSAQEILRPSPASPRGGGYHTQASSGSSSSIAPPANLRIASFQSASSKSQRSDSFELERGDSVRSNAYGAARVERSASAAGPGANGYANGGSARGPDTYDHTYGSAANDYHGARVPSDGAGARQSVQSESSSSTPGPQTAPYDTPQPGRFGASAQDEVVGAGPDDDREWEDLKPYLNTQSSALVNAIQNLLAAIRTGTHSPALDEHLSEVIAIASSIVAVATSALPAALRAEGDPLLRELVNNTTRLGEAQQAAQGAYEKAQRQAIASASFGVAKALKALMKLGGTE
ncbi:component of the polarisome [Cryptotrichosporon argae]